MFKILHIPTAKYVVCWKMRGDARDGLVDFKSKDISCIEDYIFNRIYREYGTNEPTILAYGSVMEEARFIPRHELMVVEIDDV